jgi:hypothetical protein
MKRNIWIALSVMLVASMMLTSCTPAVTTTVAPAH